ncbi:UNVERIFIED_CONTAM: hypothetical protein GTU68_000230, partial [Idotea baltica]|nr:hypothetical protein [Idotea baltica]
HRAQLNDLENIPAFLFLGFFYCLSGPSPSTALFCFRTFAASRICHSLMYLTGVFPVRAVSFTVGLFVNFFMGINAILYFML